MRYFTALFFAIFFILPLEAIETSGNLLFKIDPYTIISDRGEIILKFQLNVKTYLEILSSGRVIASKGFSKKDVHEINLGAPECNKKLTIQIKKEKKALTTHKIIFVPPLSCDPLDKITFGFLGDTQQFNNRHKRLAKVVQDLQRKDNFSFILNTGDVVNYGAHGFQWDNFFKVADLYGKNSPLVAAIGNHEYYNLLAKYTKKEKTTIPHYFNRYFRWKGAPEIGYFSLNMGTFELLVFNSNFEVLTPGEIENQWAWIEQKLKDSKKPVIVSMHYPPFSSSSFNESKEAKLLREKLVPLLEKYKVKLVLSGHTHLYERLFKSGVTYLITGPSGGAWAHPNLKNVNQLMIIPRTLTFEKISVDKREIQVEIYNEKGEILDKTRINL